MRIALVNPPWSFEGSIYFGCREPHLPLEYGYAQALLGKAGHEARIFDAHAEGLDLPELAARSPASAPTCSSSRPRRATCSGAARRRSCGCRN